MENCMFHSDRICFDIMTRAIGREKIIPRSCVHRLAMAVCSCRRNKINIRALMTEKDLRDKTKDLHERLSIETSWPDNLVDYIYQISSCDVSLKQDSTCRLIYVLHQAIFHKTYDMLTREAVSSNYEEVKKKSEIKKPLPQNIKELIMRKKLRKAKCKIDVTLPMFPGNLRTLQSSADYIKLTSGSGKPIVNVQYKRHKNTQNIQNNKSETEVLVAGDDMKTLRDFCAAIRDLAAKKQHELDVRHRIAKERRQRLKQWCKFRNTEFLDEEILEESSEKSLKDDLAENFSKRMMSHKKSQAQKNINQSVLDGGHCLSCLTPFAGLQSNSSQETCRYHPGYIYFDSESNKERWTCCDSKAMDDKPTADDHSQNGCSTGNHIWRPHKKSNRKSGFNHKEGKLGDITRKFVNQNSRQVRGRDVMALYFDSEL